MARQRYVTRMCKSTKLTVNGYNVITKQVEQCEFTIPRVTKKGFSAKELQTYLPMGVRLLDIVNTEIISELRAITFETFIENSFPYDRKTKD